MLVICNNDLVNRGLHKVDADALARAVALALDEGAMPLEIGAEPDVRTHLLNPLLI